MVSFVCTRESIVRGDLGCKHETGLGGIARAPSCLIGLLRPNGSRFSCGRTARGRKGIGAADKNPGSFNRLLGTDTDEFARLHTPQRIENCRCLAASRGDW